VGYSQYLTPFYLTPFFFLGSDPIIKAKKKPELQLQLWLQTKYLTKKN